jgi:hypothetical protein
MSRRGAVRSVSQKPLLNRNSRFELWHTVNEIVHPEDREDPVPLRYPPDAVLISVPSEGMPKYFDLLEKSQDEANDYLFDVFCLDACVHAKQCRRWVVVHDHDMPQWTGGELHVKLYTPEKYIEKFRVPPAPKVVPQGLVESRDE